MGRDKQEMQSRRAAKGRADQPQTDFWSWHPTEAQKKQFEEFLGQAGSLEEALEPMLRLGIVLTITTAKTNDSVCVVARNKFDSYGEGQALSVFHVSAERALWGMVFVTSVLFPDWPTEPVKGTQRQIDW